MCPVDFKGNEPKRLILQFRQLPGLYAVVRQSADAPLPPWAAQGDFTSITRTGDELSIVCPTENLPKEIVPDLRWVCLKLQGPFDFSLTGVLLSFISPLSGNGVPIFAISTFDTDLVLIPQEHAARATELLQQAGHQRMRPEPEPQKRKVRRT
jgi:hypothetical protein